MMFFLEFFKIYKISKMIRKLLLLPRICISIHFVKYLSIISTTIFLIYYIAFWNSIDFINKKQQNFNHDLLLSNKLVKNDWTRMCAGNVTLDEFNRLFPPLDEKDRKYLLASFNLCRGLGNQMWRFASLYGIGKSYGRRPIYSLEQQCQNEQQEKNDEMKTIFPVLNSQLKYIKLNSSETVVIDGFMENCCTYKNPKILGKFKKNFNSKHHKNIVNSYEIFFSKIPDRQEKSMWLNLNLPIIQTKYVQIKSEYFQSYKFFVSNRHEIRQIFQFSPVICKNVQIYKQQLFNSFNSVDTAHKLCVHTRIGDFKIKKWESKKNFTEEAIKFLHNLMTKKFGPVSLILLGSDKDFLMNLAINKTLFHLVYLPKAMSRGEDLAFGTIACDSLLITASASTFAWWMAYLMPDNAQIYYNSDFKYTDRSYENYLPEWKAISLNDDGIIILR